MRQQPGVFSCRVEDVGSQECDCFGPIQVISNPRKPTADRVSPESRVRVVRQKGKCLVENVRKLCSMFAPPDSSKPDTVGGDATLAGGASDECEASEKCQTQEHIIVSHSAEPFVEVTGPFEDSSTQGHERWRDELVRQEGPEDGTRRRAGGIG